MKKKYLAIIVIFVLAAGFGFGMNEYTLDPSHSSISFKIRHMVVSKVRGQFNDFSVFIKEDPNDMSKSSVTAVIKVASIDTRDEKRDKHLHSEDFFYVEKFPEITFRSKRIQKKADGFAATGTLTMRGVSKEITILFQVSEKIKDPWGNTRVGIEAEVKLDRKDYGINYNKTLDKGGLMVGNEVKIEILLEMIQKKK